MSGRKTSKRVLAFLLAFCMTATLLPVPGAKVSAAEPETTEEVVMQVSEESEAAEEPDGAEAPGSTEEIVTEIPEKTGSAEEAQPETEPDEPLSMETAEGTKITEINITIPAEKLVISPALTNGEEQDRIRGEITVTSTGCKSGEISLLVYENSPNSFWAINRIADEKVSPSRKYFAGVVLNVDMENGFYVEGGTGDKNIPLTINGTSRTDLEIWYADNPNDRHLTIYVPLTVAPYVETVTVSQEGDSVAKGSTKQFQAEVDGYNVVDTSVTWSIANQTSAGTTIDSTGLLRVGSDETAESITVIATSVADPTKSGTATVNVVDQLAITGITVTPAETKVAAGNQKTFQANVTGTAPHTVTWSVSGNSAAGTGIDPNSGELTVAEKETVGNVLTVTATSTFDGNWKASATVTVIQPEKITSIDLTIPAEKLVISPARTNGEEQDRIRGEITVTSTGCKSGEISLLVYENSPNSIWAINRIADEKVSPSRKYFAGVVLNVDMENGFYVEGGTGDKNIPLTINGTSRTDLEIWYADNPNDRHLTIYVPLTVEGYELSVTSNPPAFADRVEGYNPVSPEKITIKNTGTVKLPSIKTELTGTHADSFIITARPAVSLAKGTSTSLSVKPKDGLPVGTYEAEVRISASGIGMAKIVPLRFTVTEAERHGLTIKGETWSEYYSCVAGDVMTISAYGESDRQFLKWECEGEGVIGNPLQVTTTFIMPASDVTVTAKYEAVKKFFIEPQDYTGKALTPKVSVKDGSTELTEGKDYTVKYKNNVKAYTLKPGNESFDKKLAPQAIITMKGNYKGTETAYFIIRPHGIMVDDVSDETMTVTYTGKKQTPYPVVTCDGKKLKYGTDFIIPEYEQAKKDKDKFSGAQEYALTMEGRGNYTGCVPIKLIISESKKQLAMSKVTVKGIAKSYKWNNGYQVRPSGYKLTNGKDVLEEYKDFTVSYGENWKVGTGTITFTGTGIDYDGDGYSYIGKKTLTFSIPGTSMSKVKISGLETKKVYNGWEQRQDGVTLTVTRPDKTVQTLVRGWEYTATYANNIKKGKASVTFTGRPEYGFTGSVTKTYTIAAAPSALRVSLADGDTYAYLKGGVKPAVIVTGCEGVTLTLTEGTDYTVKYENNKAIADKSASKKAPTVIVTGKGNYTGTEKVTFTITAGIITDMVIPDKTASTKKGAWLSVPAVYGLDGVKLSSSDYDTKNIEYKLVVQNGTHLLHPRELNKDDQINGTATISVTVTGKGSYEGDKLERSYRIVDSGKDISKAVFAIDPQMYTGTAIEITSMEQFKENKSVTHGRSAYMKSGKTYTPLTLGVDFKVEEGSYVKNINKGTAQVTFVGMGAYGGRKTVTFTITQKPSGSFWSDMLALLGIVP